MASKFRFHVFAKVGINCAGVVTSSTLTNLNGCSLPSLVSTQTVRVSFAIIGVAFIAVGQSQATIERIGPGDGTKSLETRRTKKIEGRCGHRSCVCLFKFVVALCLRLDLRFLKIIFRLRSFGFGPCGQLRAAVIATILAFRANIELHVSR